MNIHCSRAAYVTLVSVVLLSVVACSSDAGHGHPDADASLGGTRSGSGGTGGFDASGGSSAGGSTSVDHGGGTGGGIATGGAMSSGGTRASGDAGPDGAADIDETWDAGRTPGGPARGAVTIAVQPAAGGGPCEGAHAFSSVPAQTAAAEVNNELMCDLGKGCVPNAYVAVDRTQGTEVNCSVKASGSGFAITVRITQATGFDFSASGIITSTGGTVAIGWYDSVSGLDRTSDNCTLTILPNQGDVRSGRIWGQFQCDGFDDHSIASASTCSGEGAFLFENCES